MEGSSALVQGDDRCYGNSIHILVNVVGGLFGRKLIEDQDEEWYDMVMNVNMKSVFFTIKATVGFMSRGASIVNLSSLAARDGGGGGSSFMRLQKERSLRIPGLMAKELGPRGIRVNAVCPGLIDTSFHDRFTKPESGHCGRGNSPSKGG